MIFQNAFSGLHGIVILNIVVGYFGRPSRRCRTDALFMFTNILRKMEAQVSYADFYLYRDCVTRGIIFLKVLKIKSVLLVYAKIVKKKYILPCYGENKRLSFGLLI